MTTKPITTEVIIPFARVKVSGLAPPKKNIIPPTINITTAIAGTKVNMINLTILLIRTKKSQNWQGQPGVPHGTKPSVGQLVRAAKT
ncbi:hypothetical protein ES703_61121 [subsurface metagenome]